LTDLAAASLKSADDKNEAMLIEKVGDSPSYAIFNLIENKKAKGEKVYSLAIGEPSFDTPKAIVRVACRSLTDGGTHYTSSYGTSEVREAIKKKVRDKNKLKADIGNTLFATTKLSVYVSLVAVSSGYEVLVPDPGYFYSEPVILSGCKPVRYRLAADFSLDLGEIKRKVTARTRALILNTPGNPTGRVFSRKELTELFVFCGERGIKIISDESYEDLVYGKQHVSIGSFEDVPDSVVSIFSLSKSYAMTGWRAGYVVAGEAVIQRMNRFLENTMTCFPPFVQAASVYALLHGEKYIRQFRKELERRKELLEAALSEVPDLETQEIDGAFYAFPKYRADIDSSEVSRRLLERHGVAVLPGRIFGPSGEKHLRLSFSATSDIILEATRRMKVFFQDISRYQ
jgi:aspartate aminotransferase